jgi:uncharacterized FlaG/YvyC family protein
MVDIDPVTASSIVIPRVSESNGAVVSASNGVKAYIVEPARNLEREQRAEVSSEVLQNAAVEVAAIVNNISSDTALSFRVEEELSRMVVAVRAVGSDEIIRQFPPEEFITVAKHIAAQTPEAMDEDYLKGILFDQRT